MYVECKGEEIIGEARIGRVTFSKSMKSIHYKDKTFETLKGVVSNQISLMLRQEKNIGYQVVGKMEKTDYMENDCQFSSTKIFRKNIGQK